MEDDLYQLLAGALSVLSEAGCALVGGHSCEGAELALGLSVTGSAPRSAILTKAGLQAGQALVLTKPVGAGAPHASGVDSLARFLWLAAQRDCCRRLDGAGTLMAADMRGGGKGRWTDAALQAMRQSSGEGRAMRRCTRRLHCAPPCALHRLLG